MNKSFPDESSFGGPGYSEYLVPVKANARFVVFRVIIIAVCAFLLFGLLMLTSRIPQIFAVWLVVIVFFGWVAIGFTKREFEYVIAEGSLRLDVIYGAKRRRKVCAVRLSDASKIAPCTLPDGSLEKLAEKKRRVYACNKNDNNMYYILYKTGDKNNLLFLSAPKRTVDSFRFYNRSALTERKF